MFKTVQLVVNNQCNCFYKMCDIGIYRASRKNRGSMPATNFMENIFFSDGNPPLSLGQRCFHHNLGNIRTHDLQTVFQTNAWLQEFREKIKMAGGYFPACTRCCGGLSGKFQRRRFPWSTHCKEVSA